jgi:hypothetical protein
VVFGLLGMRSLIHWLRRPLGSDARRDHVLFALFVVSRAGLWFALMGLFLIYASVDTQGRAFSEDAGEFAWYFIVIMVLAALHLVTVFLLGRTPPTGPAGDGDRAA